MEFSFSMPSLDMLFPRIIIKGIFESSLFISSLLFFSHSFFHLSFMFVLFILMFKFLVFVVLHLFMFFSHLVSSFWVKFTWIELSTCRWEWRRWRGWRIKWPIWVKLLLPRHNLAMIVPYSSLITFNFLFFNFGWVRNILFRHKDSGIKFFPSNNHLTWDIYQFCLSLLFHFLCLNFWLFNFWFGSLIFN